MCMYSYVSDIKLSLKFCSCGNIMLKPLVNLRTSAVCTYVHKSIQLHRYYRHVWIN